MHLFAWSWIILVVQLLCESIPYEKHWSNIFYFKMLIYLCSCKYHRLLIYKLTKVFKNVINSHMKALPRSLTNFENLQQSGWSQETRKGTTKCGDERRCKRRYRWICQLLTFWCKVSNWQIQHFFFFLFSKTCTVSTLCSSTAALLSPEQGCECYCDLLLPKHRSQSDSCLSCSISSLIVRAEKTPVHIANSSHICEAEQFYQSMLALVMLVFQLHWVLLFLKGFYTQTVWQKTVLHEIKPCHFKQ